eukprot:6383357-Amphidinium_carterae.1
MSRRSMRAAIDMRGYIAEQNHGRDMHCHTMYRRKRHPPRLWQGSARLTRDHALARTHTEARFVSRLRIVAPQIHPNEGTETLNTITMMVKMKTSAQ